MSESKKMLHERLRTIAIGEGVMASAYKEFDCDTSLSYDDCDSKVLFEIADEIEREYIPRPRFEDGEVVKKGDEVEKGIVRFIDVSSDGSWSLVDENGTVMNIGNAGERVKRPDPNVLDADGVPIKVGDTVWRVNRLTEYIVKAVHNTSEVEIMPKYGLRGICPASWLTHREPDTQEKIDADKKKRISSNYWNCVGCLCEKCPSLIDGKTPKEYYEVSHCMIAMGMDIARRQAELDARMRED